MPVGSLGWLLGLLLLSCLATISLQLLVARSWEGREGGQSREGREGREDREGREGGEGREGRRRGTFQVERDTQVIELLEVSRLADIYKSVLLL